MHYIIDAYNLLFRTHIQDAELQKQRHQLIHELAQRAKILELDLTLVFDSAYHPGEATKGHLHTLEIIYTAEGETADTYILCKLAMSRNLKQETVITSDKSLAMASRQLGAKAMSIEHFLLWLQARYKTWTKKQSTHTFPRTSPKRQSLPKKTPLSKPIKPEENYLQIFEKRYHELEQLEQKPTPLSAAKQVRKPRMGVAKAPPEADRDRWLRIFEERSRKPPQD